MLEYIPGLPNLVLFWMNDVSVICVSRCGIICGTLSSKYVLTLIWMIMTDGSFKIILNWAVLTPGPADTLETDGLGAAFVCARHVPARAARRCLARTYTTNRPGRGT